MARNILAPVAVAILVSATTAGAAAVITGAQIKDNSITGKDVKNKSLTKNDFRGSVRGPRGFRGRQGARGPQGAQGIQGPKGDPGSGGLDGAAIVTEARCGGCPVESGALLEQRAIPLTDSEWTQPADEANMLFIEVTLSPPPASCSPDPSGRSGPPRGQVSVFLDGEFPAIASSEAAAGLGVQTERLAPTYLFAPEADEPHTITARVFDTCMGAENATVDDLNVDVAAFLAPR